MSVEIASGSEKYAGLGCDEMIERQRLYDLQILELMQDEVDWTYTVAHLPFARLCLLRLIVLEADRCFQAAKAKCRTYVVIVA